MVRRVLCRTGNVLGFGALLIFFGALFYVIAFPDPVYKANTDVSPGEDTENDPRGALRTLTTIPEWYIVYSAQEFADFVAAGNSPTKFPFFQAISQYEEIERTMIDAAGGESALDRTTKTILDTIGISFAVEYGARGAYEMTMGRLSGYLSLGYPSREDAVIADLSREYGAFLNHTPWYAFPYRDALFTLWGGAAPSSVAPRGIERRLSYTIGYVMKGTYGRVINYLSSSNFGGANLSTRVVVQQLWSGDAKKIPGVEVLDEQDQSIELSLPRYRAFRDTLVALIEKGAEIESIQGHTEIAMSVVAQRDTTCYFLTEKRLAHFAFVTDENKERSFIQIPVNEIPDAIFWLDMCGIEVEHFYDY